MSILNVLNLTELGFSSAIVFSLYKPLAEDNKSKIGALLYFYKKVYRIIGLIILTIGCLILPFLNIFINEDIPQDINIYAVYIIYLLNTVIGYLLFSYKRSILVADQKNYITTLINTTLIIVQTIVQVVLLIVFKNFYLYVLILPVITILNNLIINFIVNKYYYNYFIKAELSPEEKKDLKTRISGLFIFKIATATRTSFDSIFISAYLGLVFVAIYSNYYYVIAGVATFIAVITTAMMASVGNKTATLSVEDNYKDFQKFDFMQMIIAGWCTVMLLVLYQPFMNNWVGDSLMLPFSTMVLFVIYFYCQKMGGMRALYNDVNGLWWEQRYRTIIESVLNIFLNWLLVYFYGLFGIILATILTILIFGFGYSGIVTFKHYFGINKLKIYYLSHAKYALVTVFISFIVYFICQYINIENIYLDFIVRGIIAGVLAFVLFVLIYIRNKHFKNNLNFFKNMIFKKRRKS